jgi:hypothetical protein
MALSIRAPSLGLMHCPDYSETGLIKKQLDSTFNVISNGANFLHRLSFGIAERPVVSMKAGHEGALISAAHGDKQLRILCQFFRKLPWLGIAKVNADFLHRCKHLRVYLLAGFCSRGEGHSPSSISELVKECRGHLRSASIMNTGKNDFEHAFLP